jgi:hypothetical protein
VCLLADPPRCLHVHSDYISCQQVYAAHTHYELILCRCCAGTAAATKLVDGVQKEVKSYKAGDFFGELALIKDQVCNWCSLSLWG